MGKGKIVGSGNAFKVTNGRMVEELSQSEVIPPYTFIQSDSWEITGSPVVKAVPFTLFDAECELINNNQFLFAYSTGRQIHHRIATLNEDSLTFGTDVVFNYDEGVNTNFQLTKISDNKFLISCDYDYPKWDDAGVLHYIVSISGSTITLGQYLHTHSSDSVFPTYTATRISNDMAMVSANRYYSSPSSEVTFLRISGNTLTNDGSVVVDAGSMIFKEFLPISSNNYLCIGVHPNYETVYAEVWTINGKTITLGTAVTLYSPAARPPHISVKKIDGTKFAVAYPYNADVSYTSSAVIQALTVNEKTITVGNAAKTMDTGRYYGSASKLSVVPFNSSTVVLIECGDYFNRLDFKVSGNTITAIGSEVMLSAGMTEKTAGLMLNNKIIAFGMNYNGSGQYAIFVPKTQHSGVKPSTGTILGITQTKITPTQKGKVWYYNK